MFRSRKSKLSIQVRVRRSLVAATLALLGTIPCNAQSIDTLALRAHTRFLSDDLLQGRGTGTAGEHIAALYIAGQLIRLGAEPADGRDFLLPIPLKRFVIDDAHTTISWRGETYRSGRHFVWNTGGRRALTNFSGPLLYVGRADSVASRRAPETRGAVIVISEAMGSAAGDFVPALIRAGAAGVLWLVRDSATFDLYARSRGRARYYVDAAVNDPIWQADIPMVIAGPALANIVMPDSARPRFSRIEGTVAGTLRGVVEDVKAANVAGIIRGSDAKLATEFVAFSAHYDHLGISTPDARGDSIYNGFSDNAAGVAMLLAIGDAFKRERPARSILLLFFTGEERGLLGSSYYVTEPPIPLNKMTALINLDAGAPPAPPVEWRIAGGATTPLGQIAKAALAARSWDAHLGQASPNSDYWPFLTRGVNAIFIIPGSRWENVDEPQQRALRGRWDRYHQAGDEWKVDFPFSGLARYAEAALVVGRAMVGP